MVVYPAYCPERCLDYPSCPHKQQRAIDRCARGAVYLAQAREDYNNLTPAERQARLKKNLDELWGVGTYDAHLRMIAERASMLFPQRRSNNSERIE